MKPTASLPTKLPLSNSELLVLFFTAPNRYKVHTIQKRHGRGDRVIAQPTAEVKLVQRAAVKQLRPHLPIHSCATAYRDGLSIKDHALPHAKNRYLLKIDFRDFFPSIVHSDFSTHLQRHLNWSKESADFYSNIFFWRPKKTNDRILAIGAPSSPWLSNTILFEFDTTLATYCSQRKVAYTRYADDLALSTDVPFALQDALQFVKQTCADLPYPRLVVNDDKTVFTSKKNNRTLTGLVLANDGTVSIGRERKREIRALAHWFLSGKAAPEDIGRLRGLLSYTLSIDPDFNLSIIRMIGKTAYDRLMHPS